MPTRQEVEAAITAIETGGNNTAVEVQEVLTRLLDYTENINVISREDIFHHSNRQDPFTNHQIRLFYTFKGIREYTFNFLLILQILEPVDSLESIPIEPEVMADLSTIISGGGWPFVSSYLNDGLILPTSLTTNYDFNENLISFGVSPQILETSQFIFVNGHLHSFNTDLESVGSQPSTFIENLSVETGLNTILGL